MERRLLRGGLVLAVGFAVVGCGAAGESLANLGFSVRCDGSRGDGGVLPCEWTVIEGSVRYGGTWNPADLGLDLSGGPTVEIEQRTTFESPTIRDYALSATVLQEGAARVSFELRWYRAPASRAADYWATQPELLRSYRLEVTDSGLTRFRGLATVPSEAGGLALRIRRVGEGRAWVDEIALGAPRGSSASP